MRARYSLDLRDWSRLISRLSAIIQNQQGFNSIQPKKLVKVLYPLTRLLTNHSHPRSGTFVGSLAHVCRALEDPDSAMLTTTHSKERHEGRHKGLGAQTPLVRKRTKTDTMLQGLYNWNFVTCSTPAATATATTRTHWHSDSIVASQFMVCPVLKDCKMLFRLCQAWSWHFLSQRSQCIGSRSLHGQILHTCFRLWFGTCKHSFVIFWMSKWTQALGDFPPTSHASIQCAKRGGRNVANSFRTKHEDRSSKEVEARI